MLRNIIQAKTKTGLQNYISSGSFSDNDIAIIEESGQLYFRGKYYSAVPSGGEKGQILGWKADGEAQWIDINLEEVFSYGVEWDITVADPHLTRIGNPLLHKQLPVQSSMRGCIAQGDQIQYYLDASDWSKKEDGTTSRLDGYDGTVQIHIKPFYIKFVEDENIRRVKISTVGFDPTWIYIPEMLVDAYRSTVLNTVPENMGYLSTLPVNSAISVVNTNSYCRGGNNSSSYDQYLESDPFRTMLGKPRTQISRASMRNYCRNANREMLSYEQYKYLFYWLYVIEYANFNSQEEYKADLTSDGYRQGGLGNGVTTGNYDHWNHYNGRCSLTPCGYCNDIGNGTGIKEMVVVMPTTSGGEPTQSYTFQVPRWRGFDNPFGDTSTNLDGVLIDTPLAGASDASVLPTCYIINDPDKYTDDLATAQANAVRSFQMPHNEGYIKEWQIGQYGDTIPKTLGGNSTQYMCDYYHVNYDDTPEALFVGGGVSDGSVSGFSCFSAAPAVSTASSAGGFRSVSCSGIVGGLNGLWGYIY